MIIIIMIITIITIINIIIIITIINIIIIIIVINIIVMLGEVGNATSSNRRIVGHGNLAEKALKNVMPSFTDFPYVIRLYAGMTL